MQCLIGLVQDINKSGKKYTLAITGGGCEAIGELLKYGGGSATMLGTFVPYNQNALSTFLGYKVEKSCSEETARKMALRSFQWSLKLGAEPSKAVGFGITCSLARGSADGEIREDGSRRQHWVHVAFHDKQNTWVYSINLTESGMSREGEEGEAANLVVKMIWNFLCGHDSNAFNRRIGWPYTENGNLSEPNLQLQDLMCGKTNIAKSLGLKRGTREDITEFDGKPYSRGISKLIYSGSFNPIHEGHLKIAQLGMQKTGEKVTFEICIENPDKPPLDWIDMEQRFIDISCDSACFRPGRQNNDFTLKPIDYENVIFTRLPLFKDKFSAFPAHTFMMGADTAIRFCDEKYGSVRKSLDALDDNECRVIITERQGFDLTPVKERLTAYGQIMTGIEFVPESEYKDCGISSSKLRNDK